MEAFDSDAYEDSRMAAEDFAGEDTYAEVIVVPTPPPPSLQRRPSQRRQSTVRSHRFNWRRTIKSVTERNFIDEYDAFAEDLLQNTLDRFDQEIHNQLLLLRPYERHPPDKSLQNQDQDTAEVTAIAISPQSNVPRDSPRPQTAATSNADQTPLTVVGTQYNARELETNVSTTEKISQFPHETQVVTDSGLIFNKALLLLDECLSIETESTTYVINRLPADNIELPFLYRLLGGVQDAIELDDLSQPTKLIEKSTKPSSPDTLDRPAKATPPRYSRGLRYFMKPKQSMVLSQASKQKSPPPSPGRGQRDRQDQEVPTSPSPIDIIDTTRPIAQATELNATHHFSSTSPILQSGSPTFFPNLRPNFSPTNIHRPNTTELMDTIKVSTRRFSLSGMYPHNTSNHYKMDGDATAEDYVTWTAPYVRKKFQILPAIPPLNFSTINMLDGPLTPAPPNSAPSAFRKGCDSPLMMNPPIQQFSARPPPKIPVKLRTTKKEYSPHAHVLSQKVRK